MAKKVTYRARGSVLTVTSALGSHIQAVIRKAAPTLADAIDTHFRAVHAIATRGFPVRTGTAVASLAYDLDLKGRKLSAVIRSRADKAAQVRAPLAREVADKAIAEARKYKRSDESQAARRAHYEAWRARDPAGFAAKVGRNLSERGARYVYMAKFARDARARTIRIGKIRARIKPGASAWRSLVIVPGRRAARLIADEARDDIARLGR